MNPGNGVGKWARITIIILILTVSIYPINASINYILIPAYAVQYNITSNISLGVSLGSPIDTIYKIYNIRVAGNQSLKNIASVYSVGVLQVSPSQSLPPIISPSYVFGYVFQPTKIPFLRNMTLVLENVTLGAGDILAPHLADWYFDGVDDYLEIPHTNSLLLNEFTVELMIKMPPQGGTMRIIEKGGYRDNGGFGIEDAGGGKANFLVWDGPSYSGYRPLNYVVLDSTWHHIAFMYANYHIWVGIDGVLRGDMNVTYYKPSTEHITIARASMFNSNFHNGRVAQVMIYNRTLSQREIYESYQYHVVNATGLVLFIDPTFYNGTHYLDLVGGNVGIPHNGVVRKPADNLWLWLVKNGASDGLLHVKYAPAGSLLVISYNGVEWRTLINGSTTDEGRLVVDYTIDLTRVFGTSTLEGATVKLIYPAPSIAPPTSTTTTKTKTNQPPGGVITYTGPSISVSVPHYNVSLPAPPSKIGTPGIGTAAGLMALLFFLVFYIFYNQGLTHAEALMAVSALLGVASIILWGNKYVTTILIVFAVAVALYKVLGK